MDVDTNPESFIQQLAIQAPEDLKPVLAKCWEFYSRKLWYQLTNSVQEFLSIPSSFPLQISFYNNFIKEFKSKINPLKHVEIAVAVSQRFSDASEALDFLSSLADKLKPMPPNTEEKQNSISRPAGALTKKLETDPSAYVLAKMSAAHFCLLLGKTADIEAAIHECRTILDGLDEVDTSVRAGFYRVAGDYHKWEAAYASYYKTSLLYLACLRNVNTDLSLESRIQRAHDLGLAALLGDTIYNFGELLQHPILESLSGTPFEWIRSLLFAFNEGNLGVFESLAPRFPEEPILQNSYPFLRQKICLMALIDAVFRRNVTDRTMSFVTIATETKLPVNEVEHLVMKALSLGLVKGSLDQVSATANITWVHPRVLNRQQIQALKVKLDEWTTRVAKVGEYAQANGGQDIIVQ